MFDEPEAAEQAPPPPPRRSRAIVVTLVVLAVFFLALTGFATFWTERLWFDSVGFVDVFGKLIWTRIGLFGLFGGVMALVVALCIAVAYRTRPFYAPSPSSNDSLGRYREAVFPIRGWLTGGLAVLLGAFAGASAANQWREFSLWRNGVPFGTTDDYFGKDVGFYVFDLPWWHYVTDYVMTLAVIGLIVSVLVHYLYGGINLQPGSGERMTGAAQAQVSVLLGVFVLAKAVDYYLDRFDLLSQNGSLITGMSYTRDNAVLPAKNILMGIAVICAILCFLNVWRRTWTLPSLGIALLALSAILLGLIWPGVVQRFQVNPSEADREAPYIERNIQATRAAYDIDDVQVEPFTSSVDPDASIDDLDTATASVPLVDPKIVSATFENQQQVRAYYSVADVLDVDRYDIEGRDRAVVVGVRELDQSGLPEGDQNWSNLHTVYTHGNGVIAAYANQRPADDERQNSLGEVQYAEGQDIDESDLTELFPDGYEDRIYYGENSPSYSIVGRDPDGQDRELDLPKGERDDENQTTSYDGDGGVAVGSLFKKVLYALKFGEPNLVLSSRVHEYSKILYDRDPAQMVEKVAPWLTVDADPYPAIIDGKVQWILDGYTLTDRYPQAQKESFDEMTDDSLQVTPGFQTLPTDEVNYVRNAVKATVDAYDGTVRLYAWDEEDPILQAWRKVFPGVVEDKDQIPDALMEHLRYPEDLFKLQRYQFARYHVENPNDFYESNNRWQVPTDPQVDDTLQAPYRLYVEDGDQFALTSVYTPYRRNNLAAFLSVDSDATDPDGYGTMTALELPNEQVEGPAQVANNFSSDEKVTEALLSFRQAGSRITFGNLLTLPVNGALMYVQPLYIQRDTTTAGFPELRYTLVSYGGRIGVATTLRGAIEDALETTDTTTDPTDPGTEPTDPETDPEQGGTDPGTDPSEEPEPEPTGTVDEQIRELLNRADQKFRQADEAQRSGDSVLWATRLEEARDLIARAVELSSSSGSSDGSSGDGSGEGSSGN